MCYRHDIPDQQLQRDFDISVDVTMTSVIYTHTKRFPIEIINFLQDVLEHHDSIGHMRAASQGQQVSVISTMVKYTPYMQKFHLLGVSCALYKSKKSRQNILLLPNVSDLKGFAFNVFGILLICWRSVQLCSLSPTFVLVPSFCLNLCLALFQFSDLSTQVMLAVFLQLCVFF